MIKKSGYKQLGLVLVSILICLSGKVFAAGGNYSSDVDLRPIMKMLDDGQFETAIDELHYELDYDPDNADILSLIGFCYRKIRNYQDALTYYSWALQSEPKHKGAIEYLGELYLETGQLPKAVEQLEVLDGLCRSSCVEYSKLKKAIDSYQQQASN